MDAGGKDGAIRHVMSGIDQQSIFVGCVVKALKGAQLLNMIFEHLVVLFFRLTYGLPDRWPLSEFKRLVGFNKIIV
jgi:hypothetical protein